MELLAIVFATFVSEDLTAIGVGLLAARGEVALASGIAACTLGIYLGDLGLWAAGRLFGARVLAIKKVRVVVPHGAPERFRGWFDDHSAAVIVGSRFAPGTRLPLYVAAGACRTSFARFAAWSLVASIMWTPALVLASAALGRQVEAWFHWGRVSIPFLALALFVTARNVPRALTVRRRQRLAASLSRIWRWEFWPMWLFYAPVALWTAWLAIRYGGFTTMMASNPGIPDGGVVGESKFEILRRLPGRWTIPAAMVHPGAPETRVAVLRETLQRRGWAFPIVLKPDVGQRGAGVRVVRSERDAAAYVAAVAAPVIAQPYHPGPFEAGIFYYRFPGSCRGRILTITDKIFPVVVGDGRSSIEDLIWTHPRYRMQARTFLTRFGVRAQEVPAAGERIPLANAGNHAQGTMFRDGRHLITPALEARIDEIARSYDGFFVGRFDVRYANREAFLQGEDLAIVELNGATAECTNIYDPDNSLMNAYRQLFEQWQLVFEIGAANRRRGLRPGSWRRLRHLLVSHAREQMPLPVAD